MSDKWEDRLLIAVFGVIVLVIVSVLAVWFSMTAALLRALW